MGQLMHYLFQVDMCMSLTFVAKEHFESVSSVGVPGVLHGLMDPIAASLLWIVAVYEFEYGLESHRWVTNRVIDNQRECWLSLRDRMYVCMYVCVCVCVVCRMKGEKKEKDVSCV